MSDRCSLNTLWGQVILDWSALVNGRIRAVGENRDVLATLRKPGGCLANPLIATHQATK